MIFYGKASRRVAVAAALGELELSAAEAVAARLPIERHAAWVTALVEAGGLAQGLADAEGDVGPDVGRDVGPDVSAGVETGARPSDRAMALCLALAGVVGRSWDSAFADLPAAVPAPVAQALAALRRSPSLPATVEVRRTEGFSHYAVYPEGHWCAARRLEAPRPTRALGLLSIGATLAASVAAALDAPPPRTARPRGHPFARAVDIAPPLDADERAAVWAVVDEGPGLSGSSIGAAADALAGAGVPSERIALLPGHAGPPGAMASEAHRRLWATARSTVVTFDELAGDAARGIAAWAADLTGPLRGPPEDVAGGAWRRHLYADESRWPAVDRQNERRKVLLRGERRTVLMRFAGLGLFGREKLRRAEALHGAGFGLPPLALRHGFLVEPWRDDLRPASLDGPDRGGLDAGGLRTGGLDRGAALARLAAYLAFRAGAFPARPDAGAALDALLDMARGNAAEALDRRFGGAVASYAALWAGRLPALARVARPVAVDGRLAPHEWLHDGAGALLKADALDHCCGHDLVGCQDVAWDVAGAAVEWDLTDREAEALRGAVERASGAPCAPDLVAFFRFAYPAFRAGALAMALDREGGAGSARPEALRLGAALGAQAAALERAIGAR